eukprot:GILI01061854.1.p1 GENE.GILI01061854.1~~GILI01061854.1.p1  ORF type:complete len:180 (+),score=30.89 GILI01061854.1:73-540(+)
MVDDALVDFPDSDDLMTAIVLSASPQKVVAERQNGERIEITGEGNNSYGSGRLAKWRSSLDPVRFRRQAKYFSYHTNSIAVNIHPINKRSCSCKRWENRRQEYFCSPKGHRCKLHSDKHSAGQSTTVPRCCYSQHYSTPAKKGIGISAFPGQRRY